MTGYGLAIGVDSAARRSRGGPRRPASRRSGRRRCSTIRSCRCPRQPTATSRIELGTSIALAFVRSPWVTALAALDLDAMSGGRFTLGLGTGLKRFNERWHGVAYGKPTPHIREVVQIIRLISENAHRGEPIRFRGQFYDLDIQGWQRPAAPVRERFPIYLAGVREGMIRTAAQVADGLLGHPIYSLRWVRDVVLPSLAVACTRRDVRARTFVCASASAARSTTIRHGRAVRPPRRSPSTPR